MTELPRAARRLRDRAGAAGLEIDVRVLPDSTRTAAEAARACGCDTAQIVKSLVFLGRETGRPYLLLVAGSNRVDEATVAEVVGEPLVRPDAARVRELSGFSIGGIPPIGHDTPPTTLIDEALLRHEIVWAAAGTPNSVFSVAPAVLARIAGARPLRVSGDAAADR